MTKVVAKKMIANMIIQMVIFENNNPEGDCGKWVQL